MNFEVYYDHYEQRWCVRLKDGYGVVLMLSVNLWVEREGVEKEMETIAQGLLSEGGDVPVVVQLGDDVGTEFTRLSEFR